MRKSRLTKNQTLYQKEIKRIQRSMRRYAKQGYEFATMETYFPQPKRITRKKIEELKHYRGISIRNLGTLVQEETSPIDISEPNNVQQTNEEIPDYTDLARVQMDNLYSELDNFPAEIKSFLVQQFDDIMYSIGLNAIEEYDENINTDDEQAVREYGRIFLAMTLQNRPSLIFYIQNSGYGSWQAIKEYCSDIINELSDLGVLGESEKDELEDLFEMQLGYYENMSINRKAQRKAEREQAREQIRKIRKAGSEYKNGHVYYSQAALAKRMKKLQEIDTEKIAKMSLEEFNRWKKGYRK